MKYSIQDLPFLDQDMFDISVEGTGYFSDFQKDIDSMGELERQIIVHYHNKNEDIFLKYTKVRLRSLDRSFNYEKILIYPDYMTKHLTPTA